MRLKNYCCIGHRQVQIIVVGSSMHISQSRFVNQAHKSISNALHHLKNPKMYPSTRQAIQYADSKYTVLKPKATSKHMSHYKPLKCT